jgi:hypothetical protein
MPSEMLGGLVPGYGWTDLLMLLEEPAKAGFVQIAFPSHFAAKASHACLADPRIVQPTDRCSVAWSFLSVKAHFILCVSLPMEKASKAGSRGVGYDRNRKRTARVNDRRVDAWAVAE